MTTRLAVTTDWIHRCADLVFQCMNYEEEEEEEHDEHPAQSPRTGPLCEGHTATERGALGVLEEADQENFC